MQQEKNCNIFNERRRKTCLDFFFLSPLLLSLLLPSFSILLCASFARCIFHHLNPFYVVSKEFLRLAQRTKRFFNVLKCMFVCRCGQMRRENENKKKVIRHILLCTFSSLSERILLLFSRAKCIYGRTQRRNAPFDKPFHFSTHNYDSRMRFVCILIVKLQRRDPSDAHSQSNSSLSFVSRLCP